MRMKIYIEYIMNISGGLEQRTLEESEVSSKVRLLRPKKRRERIRSRRRQRVLRDGFPVYRLREGDFKTGLQ